MKSREERFLSTHTIKTIILVLFLVIAAWIIGYFWGEKSVNSHAATPTLVAVHGQDEELISSTPAATSATPVKIISPQTTPKVTAQTIKSIPTKEAHSTPDKQFDKTTIGSDAILSIVRSMYLQGTNEMDSEKLQISLSILDEAVSLGYLSSTEIAKYKKPILYALDALAGTMYIDSKGIQKILLADNNGMPLIQPIDMSLSDDELYVIDSGTLYFVQLPSLEQFQEHEIPAITMTPILTPTAQIDGFPVKEIVAVDAESIKDGLYVLDKSNDIFYFNKLTKTWSLHRSQASNYTKPDPHFLNIATYGNRLYLLDTSRNQIWRYPPNEAGAAYLNSDLLWLQPNNEPNVTECVDLAVDGSVYTLDRQGLITQYTPDLAAKFHVSTTGLSHIDEWNERAVVPVALFTKPDIPLFVADAGRRRVAAYDKKNGTFLRQWVFADNPEFDRLHSLHVNENVLYMLAGNHLYVYQIKDMSVPPPLTGVLPEFVLEEKIIPASLNLLSVYPNDPKVADLLAKYQLRLPIAGKVLPQLFVFYPGARRAYRYGVHQGIDFYEQDKGVRMKIGSPVFAAADGVVIRADIDFQEMTMDELNANLQIAHDQHFTPPDILDKLGGRQVWIDHGDGLITKYLHLSEIPEEIKVGTPVTSGQIIGYVGLSGTPDGIEGNLSYPHLHFEIRFGEDQRYYLGQWLTIDQTRRLLESLFGVQSSS